MDFHINFLANLIIQEYFLDSRCLIIFSDNFNTLNYAGNIPIVRINVQDTNLYDDIIFQYFGCQAIIISNNQPIWTFQMFENSIKLNMERFNNRKYLILPGTDQKENLTDIFEVNELTYVSDLVIVEEYNGNKSPKDINKMLFMAEEHVTYSLWTHQYVGMENNNRKILLDFWSSDTRSFKFQNELFPNKLLHQMGRILRMATFEYEPYSIIGSSEDEHRGSEMSVVLAFSKQLNMTPVLVVNPEDYWGEIFKNWSGTGLLGNLAMDKADMGFSALYTWEVDYHFLDLSKPLVRTGITCLVPAPKLAAGWLTPLFSYSPYMWIAVGTVFFICILCIFCLHYIYNKMIDQRSRQGPVPLFGYSIFSIIKLFVIQVVTKKEIPGGISGRLFMSLLFLFSLFLTSTYSSGLSSIMTIPRYENPINTVREFVESGLYWGATQEAWISSIEEVEEPMYKTVVARFIPTTEENLREYSKTGKFAFSLERLPHENFAIGSYIQEDVIGDFHLMVEDFYWEQCVIMTRKNSVLLPLLDEFILKVFESGLIGYWQNEAVSLYMDSGVQKAVKYYYHHHQEHTIVKLKWGHVQGAFGILCLGYVISVVVFVLEVFSRKLKNNPYSIGFKRNYVKVKN